MTPAYAAAGAVQAQTVRVAAVSFDRPVLCQIAAAVIPAMGAVAVGRPSIGAIYLLAVLGVCLVYHIFTRTPAAASAVMIGVLPAWMLLRNFFFYNSVELVLGACVFAWME